MTPRDRIAIGGLGGMTPVIMNLLVVDMVSTLASVTLIVGLAYMLRVLAMVAAGGIVGWLHEDELKPSKVFQLGMVAPALLTGLMNGAALRVDSVQHGQQAGLLAATVRAAEQAPVVTADVPQETIGQQVFRGAFGIKTNPQDWILVTAATAEEREARRMFAEASRAFPSLKFVLFRPSGGLKMWTLTIGGQMTREEVLATKETIKPESGLTAIPRQIPK